MSTNNTFRILLIAIFTIGILNTTYANGGPIVGENEAKAIAQSYLNSHNLHYKAISPGFYDWQVKVKDVKTGKVKWVSMEEYSNGINAFDDRDRYYWIEGVNETWAIPVNNNNKKNVGRIYVDAENGDVLKVIINGKVLKDLTSQKTQTIFDITKSQTDQSQPISANTTNTTNQVPQDTLDKPTAIILAVVSILIIAGIGFWFNNRKNKL